MNPETQSINVEILNDQWAQQLGQVNIQNALLQEKVAQLQDENRELKSEINRLKDGSDKEPE